MFEPSLDVGPGTARLFVSQYVSVSDLLHTRALHQLETDDERVSVCGPPVEQGCDTCSLEGVGKRAGDGTRGFPQYSTVRAAAWPANKVAFSLGGRSDFVFWRAFRSRICPDRCALSCARLLSRTIGLGVSDQASPCVHV